MACVGPRMAALVLDEDVADLPMTRRGFLDALELLWRDLLELDEEISMRDILEACDQLGVSLVGRIKDIKPDGNH